MAPTMGLFCVPLRLGLVLSKVEAKMVCFEAVRKLYVKRSSQRNRSTERRVQCQESSVEGAASQKFERRTVSFMRPVEFRLAKLRITENSAVMRHFFGLFRPRGTGGSSGKSYQRAQLMSQTRRLKDVPGLRSSRVRKSSF